MKLARSIHSHIGLAEGAEFIDRADSFSPFPQEGISFIMKGSVRINHQRRFGIFFEGLLKLNERLQCSVSDGAEVDDFKIRKLFLEQPWVSLFVIERPAIRKRTAKNPNLLFRGRGRLRSRRMRDPKKIF